MQFPPSHAFHQFSPGIPKNWLNGRSTVLCNGLMCSYQLKKERGRNSPFFLLFSAWLHWCSPYTSHICFEKLEHLCLFKTCSLLSGMMTDLSECSSYVNVPEDLSGVTPGADSFCVLGWLTQKMELFCCYIILSFYIITYSFYCFSLTKFPHCKFFLQICPSLNNKPMSWIQFSLFQFNKYLL